MPGTSNEKGTGIGLLLCKEYIDAHHGNIWVESTPGLGTTFHVSLPDEK
jgi:signal transduction histidine kinase